MHFAPTRAAGRFIRIPARFITIWPTQPSEVSTSWLLANCWRKHLMCAGPRSTSCLSSRLTKPARLDFNAGNDVRIRCFDERNPLCPIQAPAHAKVDSFWRPYSHFLAFQKDTPVISPGFPPHTNIARQSPFFLRPRGRQCVSHHGE